MPYAEAEPVFADFRFGELGTDGLFDLNIRRRRPALRDAGRAGSRGLDGRCQRSDQTRKGKNSGKKRAIKRFLLGSSH